MLIYSVSWVTVIVSAIAMQALGAFWYSPKGFGEAWMKEAGLTKSDMKKAQKEGMGKKYAFAFVGAIITAVILSQLVNAFGASTMGYGAKIGFLAWLGFVAPMQLGSVLWDGKNPRYFYINTGYSLVSLVIVGAILAAY